MDRLKVQHIANRWAASTIQLVGLRVACGIDTQTPTETFRAGKRPRFFPHLLAIPIAPIVDSSARITLDLNLRRNGNEEYAAAPWIGCDVALSGEWLVKPITEYRTI